MASSTRIPSNVNEWVRTLTSEGWEVRMTKRHYLATKPGCTSLRFSQHPRPRSMYLLVSDKMKAESRRETI